MFGALPWDIVSKKFHFFNSHWSVLNNMWVYIKGMIPIMKVGNLDTLSVFLDFLWISLTKKHLDFLKNILACFCAWNIQQGIQSVYTALPPPPLSNTHTHTSSSSCERRRCSEQVSLALLNQAHQNYKTAIIPIWACMHVYCCWLPPGCINFSVKSCRHQDQL